MALIGTPSLGLRGLVFPAIGLLIAVGFLRFSIRLYRVRTLFRNISKKHGIPIIPHSFLFGHLIPIGKHMAKLPRDLHGQCLPLVLKETYPDIYARGLIYLDIWPISPPMLAVFHPEIMNQFTVAKSPPKHEHLHHEFQDYTQCLDLVTSEGQHWKTWRSYLNPGFSAKNLTRLVPEMVEEIEVFRDWLRTTAMSGQVVSLAHNAEKLTVDIIGRLALGCRLHSQTKRNDFYKAIKDQTAWIPVDNRPELLFTRNWNPIRPLAMWNNSRIMKDYMMPLVQEMLTTSREEGGPKALLSFATDAFTKGKSTAKIMDPTFMDALLANMKIFMIAGHDTTASIFSFACHLLSTNPKVRDAIRREHDEVFGPDLAAVTTKIIAEPTLLNKLPYTTSVIKETLRLFPPFGTIRAGSADLFLTHPDTGVRYPTEGMMIFGCSMVAHRFEDFWPEPNRCIPERWLVPEGDPLHPRSSAYRPFELGPRNCIGQEMAMQELRLILAMTVREFDIDSKFPADSPRVFGDTAYQTMEMGQLSACPTGGMPVRVRSLRNGVGHDDKI